VDVQDISRENKHDESNKKSSFQNDTSNEKVDMKDISRENIDDETHKKQTEAKNAVTIKPKQTKKVLKGGILSGSNEVTHKKSVKIKTAARDHFKILSEKISGGFKEQNILV